MDNLTHGLLGYSVYAITKKDGLEPHKKYYALAAILGAEISDIDAYTYGNLRDYLEIHRGITHAVAATPFLALLASIILFLLARKKRKELSFKRMYWLSFIGMITHWLFDWFNTWGTGLLEPFVHTRYSLGFLPIVDILLLIAFLVGFILRKYIGSRKAFRIVGSFIALYILLQASQNLWIKHDFSSQYEQVTVAAGFVPGEFTVVGKNGSTFEIFPASLLSSGEKTLIQSNNDPIIVEKAMHNDLARAIAWWSPFYAITLGEDGKYAIVFDPRFYRNGESFVRTVVDIAGD